MTAVAPFIERLRDEARQRFAELGYPTTRNEDWRFTSVAPIARTTFVPELPVYQRHGGALPKGVKVSSLAEALRERPQAVEQHLARYADYKDQAFVALNTANFEDGLFIEIEKGAIVAEPIHLRYNAAANGHPTVNHPRNLVVAGVNSQATIIESYAGAGGYFTNAVTEIAASDDSVIDHYKLQTESADSFHVSTTQVQLGRNANFRSHSLSFGGALVRNDVNAIVSQGSECTLNGLYLVAGKQHIDNHTAIDHAQPNAASHELYKGILDGKSTAVFNGKIFVRKDAQKTDAKQTNKNLVLSEDAMINTKPELQIHADDVRCTHGATIGQLDAEGIFYLQSRGIGYADARDLLIVAFARDIIDRVKVASLRDQLEKLLLEKLHGVRR